MSWTRIGTVSVTNNSNAVTGAGTAFLTNSRIGDAFLGPDGVLYEVINVGSDTAISISPNYKGATNASAAYALIPVQGYPKALADAFTTLNSQFGATLAALGSSGTAAGIKTALGLDTTNGIGEGSNNLYFTQARVLATPLAGLVTTSSVAVVAADSILVGVGKLQAQVAAAAVLANAALPKSGGTLTGPINDAPTPTIASAASIDIGAATSNIIAISGTTAITTLGTIAAGARRTLRFLGVLALTYNPTSLILPTGANITTAANDTAEFLSLGGGNWLCLRYSLANGKTLAKDFAYDRSNVVGTLSQSGGLPTGPLMEYITNANGEAWKFVNGLMVCTRLLNLGTVAITGNNGSAFYAGVGAINYAATFAAIPSCKIGAVSSAGLVYTSEGSAFSTVSATAPFFIQANQSVTVSVTATVIAIGRWF